MILVIGEVLVDVFPDYRRIGGAPFNFALHLKHLGEKVRFVSRIGKDADGVEILKRLDKAGFLTQDIQVDAHYPTGQVNVLLDAAGNPHFEILPAAAYDQIRMEPIRALLAQETPEMIYFGTLIQRTDPVFKILHEVLDCCADSAKCFYDVNLRPDCYTRKHIEKSLTKADILKLNAGELAYLKQISGSNEPAQRFAARLLKQYGIELLALTKGENGSELFTHTEHLKQPPVTAKAVVDTVGAGDAYAAMLAYGYRHRWPLPQILTQASRFASKICEIAGAVPDDKRFYSEYV